MAPLHLSSHSSRQQSAGFTLAQLIVTLIIIALLITSGIVIVTTLHKNSSTNGGLKPVTSAATPTTQAQIDAARTAQNKRMCAAMSPAQKAALAKLPMHSPCSTD